MQITKDNIHNNNTFLSLSENLSVFSVFFTIQEDNFLSLSKKKWKKKWELIVLAIDMLDSHYWELTDKKEKQKISRTIDALREQKMVCEYAMMSEKKKKELSEISLLFGKKVQTSIKND